MGPTQIQRPGLKVKKKTLQLRFQPDGIKKLDTR